MADDRIERLLKGYRLPEVSRELDERVVMQATAILDTASTRDTVEEVGRSLLDGLGFGYLTWLMDVVTTSDAEYSVDVL